MDFQEQLERSRLSSQGRDSEHPGEEEQKGNSSSSSREDASARVDSHQAERESAETMKRSDGASDFSSSLSSRPHVDAHQHQQEAEDAGGAAVAETKKKGERKTSRRVCFNDDLSKEDNKLAESQQSLSSHSASTPQKEILYLPVPPDRPPISLDLQKLKQREQVNSPTSLRLSFFLSALPPRSDSILPLEDSPHAGRVRLRCRGGGGGGRGLPHPDLSEKIFTCLSVHFRVCEYAYLPVSLLVYIQRSA